MYMVGVCLGPFLVHDMYYCFQRNWECVNNMCVYVMLLHEGLYDNKYFKKYKHTSRTYYMIYSYEPKKPLHLLAVYIDRFQQRRSILVYILVLLLIQAICKGIITA